MLRKDLFLKMIPRRQLQIHIAPWKDIILNSFREIKINNYSDFGIWGSDESSLSSTFSKTDWVENSSFDIIVNEMLVIMNSVAIIAVALVKTLPADLEDIKLS